MALRPTLSRSLPFRIIIPYINNIHHIIRYDNKKLHAFVFLTGFYKNGNGFGIGIELGIGMETQPIMDIDIRIKIASKKRNFRLLFNLAGLRFY